MKAKTERGGKKMEKGFTYYRDLRNVREKLEVIEEMIFRIAEETNHTVNEVIADFNEIYHEYTSEYHKDNRLYLDI